MPWSRSSSTSGRGRVRAGWSLETSDEVVADYDPKLSALSRGQVWVCPDVAAPLRPCFLSISPCRVGLDSLIFYYIKQKAKRFLNINTRESGISTKFNSFFPSACISCSLCSLEHNKLPVHFFGNPQKLRLYIY
ncbi:unnamed protein product [Cuscuta campestris]|uniref:Uncharacterized protein n=1 Tax=Cuscuta campestris TaxID=132261 RepID=A0A484KLH4_9ASTE|nr:unnamed protein product [Cuscuta campestris]